MAREESKVDFTEYAKKRLNVGDNWQITFEKIKNKVLNDPDVQTFLIEHKDELTDEDIQRSYSKLYEFVNEKKKFVETGRTSVAPGYEPKLQMNFHYVDVTYEPTNELLARQQEEKIRSRIKAVNMPKDVRNARFEDIDLTDDGRIQTVSKIIDFVDNYVQSPKNFHKALYIYGDFGIGKSFVLGATANRLAHAGVETTLVNFPTFVIELRQAISTNTVQEKLDVIKKTDVLMLDDIGAESSTDWIRDEVLYTLLNYRMQEQLPTFFSSNKNMADLEKHYTFTKQGAEEPIPAKRVMERIRYLAEEVQMIGKNIRNPQ
ncbi:MAG: primosomal protein DnaI [Lactobacillales bacterium]|jgi:primosomal protein DnaI|nr:primosomal protein DnaI [Lactobacillales bacterium]